MIIEFVTGAASDRDVLVLPVASGGLAAITGRLPDGFRSTAAGAAEQARFDGAAGSMFESWFEQAGMVRRLILVGTGAGDAAGYERAGGAMTARLLTAGAPTAFADLAGASADESAHFALGAALRGWRIDRYRTRLPPIRSRHSTASPSPARRTGPRRCGSGCARWRRAWR